MSLSCHPLIIMEKFNTIITSELLLPERDHGLCMTFEAFEVGMLNQDRESLLLGVIHLFQKVKYFVMESLDGMSLRSKFNNRLENTFQVISLDHVYMHAYRTTNAF